MKIETVMWLFPVVFMIHDFEEILLFKSWSRKNKQALLNRYPRIARRILPHIEALSTAAFALAAAEEFVLLGIITFVAVEYELYGLFAGFVVAYLLHLVVHGAQFLIWKHYIPAIVTAVLTAPYTFFALHDLSSRSLIDFNTVLFWSVWATIFVGINLALSLFLARKFQRWLQRTYA